MRTKARERLEEHTGFTLSNQAASSYVRDAEIEMEAALSLLRARVAELEEDIEKLRGGASTWREPLARLVSAAQGMDGEKGEFARKLAASWEPVIARMSILEDDVSILNDQLSASRAENARLRSAQQTFWVLAQKLPNVTLHWGESKCHTVAVSIHDAVKFFDRQSAESANRKLTGAIGGGWTLEEHAYDDGAKALSSPGPELEVIREAQSGLVGFETLATTVGETAERLGDLMLAKSMKRTKSVVTQVIARLNETFGEAE